MKNNSFNRIQPKIIYSILFGLLIIGLPLAITGQNIFEGRTVKRLQINADALSNNQRRRRRKNKTPTTTSTPNPTPTPRIPDPTPTPNPTPIPINTSLSQWDIAAKVGVKIHINHDGWYFVSSNQLANNGFDLNSNPSNWQLYSNNIQIPIKINEDGSIEFYGKGNDTLYTDSTVYYLINNERSGSLRVDQYNGGSAGQTPDAVSFQNKVVFKNREFYISKLLNGEVENWFNSTVNQNITNLYINSDNLRNVGQASLKLRLQGYTYVNHIISVKINNFDLGVFNFSNLDFHEQLLDVPISVLVDCVNQITLQGIGAGNDLSLLESIELTYPKRFVANENKLSFKVPAGQTIRAEGFSENNINVYEIIDGIVSNELLINQETVNGTLGFSMAANNLDREFIAVSNSGVSEPFNIEPNIPSAWNAYSNEADFLIITPESLNSQAQTLANRRINQGLNTKVVLTEDIADEFGFGIVTPEAIRDFLQIATSNWNLKPNFVLLFGDSSFDMRNYRDGENRNLVPTKLIETFDMETSSDGWLVDFDNDGVENIAIGRLPVGNTIEAEKAVSKIVRYETQNLDNPKSALLVADTYFEILNGALEDLLPNNVSSNKVERSVLGDSQMHQQIVENANTNPTVVSYLGHATTTVWTTGSVFNSAEAQNLNNQKLSFFMLMSCLNGFTHNSIYTSLSESLLMADNGAIAVWTSSGSTYASGQIEMGQYVMDTVFPDNNNYVRIGEIVKNAKQTSSDWDARRTWQLMGDPTLIIK